MIRISSAGRSRSLAAAFVALSLALILIVSTRPALASNGYWDGQSTDWTQLDSWYTSAAGGTYIPSASKSGVPGSNSNTGNSSTTYRDSATFSYNGITNADQIVDLNATQGVGLMTFSTNAGTTTLLGGDADHVLTLNDVKATINNGVGAVTIGSSLAGQHVNLQVDTSNFSFVNNSTNVLTIENNVSVGFNGSATLSIAPAATGTGGTTFDGVISDGGQAGTAATLALIINSAAGTTTLSGANTYSGGTNLTKGNLMLGAGGTLGSTGGTLTINSGANLSTLDINGNDLTVGTFTGSGTNVTIFNNADGTNRTFTIDNGSSGNGTYAGVIADNTAGTGTIALTKNGTGTETLNGNNTFTGATTVNSGLLILGGTNTTGSVVMNAGSLQIGNGTNGSLTATPSFTFNGASMVNVKEAAGSTQAVGAIAFNGGESTIVSTYGGSDTTTLTAAAVSRLPGATVNITTSGGTVGAAGVAGTNVINFSAPLPSGAIDTGAFFNGSSYAYYDAAGPTAFIRGIAYGSDAGAVTDAGQVSEPSTPYLQTTGNVTAQFDGTTFTTINLAGGSGNNDFTLGAGQLSPPMASWFPAARGRVLRRRNGNPSRPRCRTRHSHRHGRRHARDRHADSRQRQQSVDEKRRRNLDALRREYLHRRHGRQRRLVAHRRRRNIGAASGNLTLAGGALDLGETTQTVGNLNVTMPPSAGSALQNGSLIANSYAASNPAGTATIDASLLDNGSGAGFTMNGAGTVILTSTGNTYTGGTTISKGTVQFNDANAGTSGTMLSAGTGAITLGDSNSGSNNIQLNLIPTMGTIPVTMSNPITVTNQGTGTKTISLSSTTGTFGTGLITLNGPATISGSAAAGNILYLNSVVTGSGTLAFAGANNQQIVLDPNGTTQWSNFTGDIDIQKGIILTARDAFSSPTGNNVTIEAGGELNPSSGPNTVIDALNGTGKVNGFPSTATFTIGVGNGSGVFSGVMPAGGTLVKEGTGTEEFSGPNAGGQSGGSGGPSLTKNTQINNGVLKLTELIGFENGQADNFTFGSSNNPVLIFNTPDAGDQWTFTRTGDTMTGGANATWEKLGPGTFTVTASAVFTSYTGTIAINNGTLVDAANQSTLAGILPAASPYVFGDATANTAGTLDLFNANQTMTSLSSAGTSTANSIIASHGAITGSHTTILTLARIRQQYFQRWLWRRRGGHQHEK